MEEIQQIGIEEDKNIIETKNNTLFIEQEPMKFNPLKDEEGNFIENLFEQQLPFTKYKLFLGDFIEEGTGNHKIFNTIQKAQPEDFVEIHVSSYGGEYGELIELYNSLNHINYITTFLNYGYSAGALAFLLGHERIVYEYSEFMIHSYSTGAGGKRDDFLTHIEFQDKQITNFFNKILKPYFSKKP